ncbi:restriction endonuclease subunit S [Brachyspira sp.]|uniref:restriction endonuclease subunit S n=1 Tax=Brachyspira sp. TaxID=1977261 RepID=UPI003D7C6691
MNKLPNGWQTKTIGEVCEKISAGGDRPNDCTPEKTEENQIPIFSNGIKNNGLYGYTKTPIITKPALTVSARGTIGFACVRYEPFFPIVRLICAIPNDKILVLEFLYYALQYVIPQGEGSSIPQLTIPNFKQIKIPLPPLDEQKRIASGISKIDAYLENTIKLIEEKERFKKAVTKKLLTCKEGENVPEMRFKEFNDEWKIIKLGDMFDNFTERNNEDKIMLASTRDKGVIPNNLTERKIIRKKESLSNYKLVKKGCFVISLMSFQGGFEYSDYEGIISPAYTVLKPKIEMAHYFYKYYFKSYKFIKDLKPYAEGIRHGKQIKFNACKDILVPYPSIKEQEYIGKFLSLLDAEIDNLKEQKEEIKKMKKGIINKLMNGEIKI